MYNTLWKNVYVALLVRQSFEVSPLPIYLCRRRSWNLPDLSFDLPKPCRFINYSCSPVLEYTVLSLTSAGQVLYQTEQRATIVIERLDFNVLVGRHWLNAFL
ncbi:hypothetical protein RRG08_018903 [Elysia crispata]|uniref:Uncharacterized protein n=1 Tax=Elysia crispata TaxID=231223 RepID=A0AAE1A9S5_9GAST|nr:hypothetical protein RRG08_018903 [Elysia crispata]